MLNPQWVRSFAAVAESGSFTRAADGLSLTQAAVSQHIRHLEERLGPLLLRRSRRSELTPAGLALLDYWRELDQADRRLQIRLSDAEASGGEVGLITPGSIGLFLYPLLLDLQASQPGLVIRHRFAPDAEVIEAVMANRFDAGLVSFKPDDPRLHATPFAEEPLELVVPQGAEGRSWQDLERLGFIDHPDGQAMAARLLTRRFPRAPGIRALPRSGFSNQIGLILEPVSRGLGFTVLPRFARQAFSRPETIEVVEAEGQVIDTLWLVRRSEWPLPLRVEKVVSHLRETMRVGQR